MAMKSASILVYTLLFIFGSVGCKQSLAQVSSATSRRATVTVRESILQRLLNEKVKIEFKESSFEGALKMLSKRIHLNFLADDVPSEEKLSFKYDGELKSLIDKFASFYDYSWKVGNSGEVQMMKQFSATHDYPQAHLKEMLQTAKEMQSVHASLGSYAGKEFEEPFRMKKLYQSFSQDQIAYLNSGKEVRASELSPTQFELLMRATSSFLLNKDAQSCEEMNYRLKNLPRSTLEQEFLSGSNVVFLNFAPSETFFQKLYIRSYSPSSKSDKK